MYNHDRFEVNFKSWTKGWISGEKMIINVVQFRISKKKTTKTISSVQKENLSSLSGRT